MNIESLWVKVKITYLDFNQYGGGSAQYAMTVEGESLEAIESAFYEKRSNRQIDAFFEVIE